jgi:hypothetical protein
MISQVVLNIGWAITFSVTGAIIGAGLVIAAAGFLPRMIDRLTPSIDEDKEILRGNLAVAEYFGRITASAIIGVSIVIAASILGGFIAALHG